MHKKIVSELDSLAHSILKMRDKDDIFALKEKASQIYEKLSVLAYIEEYVNTTPQATQTKEELLSMVKNAEKLKATENKVGQNEQKTEKLSEEIVLNVEPKNNIDEIEVVNQEIIIPKTEQKVPKEDLKVQKKPKKTSLEDELQDTLSVDVMTDLFTKAETKKSLNDTLNSSIQIELNDKIAFVKHLFDGNKQDFDKTINNLNNAKTLSKAMDFVQELRLKYDWSEKIGYEERLIEIIERKFI